MKSRAATRLAITVAALIAVVSTAGFQQPARAIDQANRLTGYGTAATYAYNGDGLRMSKTVSSTTPFAWDIAQGLPLLLVDGATSYVYGPGGLPLAQIDGSAVTYYHHDQLGSVRALTNPSGSVIATYTYDPYGQLAGSTGTATTPFGFAGQYTDQETGFQYLRARYYDPGTGVFLTRDPLEAQTREPYGYVGGNPLNATDPSGLFRIPGTNICIDIRDPNCQSIAEQHPETMQHIVNFAGGVLEVNPITAFLPLDLEGHGVDPCSGWYDAGRWGMTALDIAIPVGAGTAAVRAGKEISVGAKGTRIAPWGNRTGHPTGRFPHYHRRQLDPTGKVLPNQGIKRHRPWDTKPGDASFWDRF